MPNVKRNTGFRPYGEVRRTNKYIADAAIYPGDAVVHGSSGNVVAWSSSGTAILGVAMGYAASQGAEVLVWDHPDQEFVVQSDGSTPAGQLDVFLNYTIAATSASTQYKVSRMQLSGISGATGATMPLKALFLDNRADNAFGTYADVVVIINNHVQKGGTGQAGV